MKNTVFVALAVLGLLVGAMACGVAEGGKDTNPPGAKMPPAPNKYLVAVSGEDFGQEAHIVRDVEVKAGEVFTVALDSNLTTGFQWNAQASITDAAVLKQVAHEYIAPRAEGQTAPVAGMAGIEEWTFAAGQAGTAVVTVGYSRPWEGGEKNVRTFELTVVVK